jgi:hypothetical protein
MLSMPALAGSLDDGAAIVEVTSTFVMPLLVLAEFK